MSPYEPFGVGKIQEDNYFVEATDYVVPNDQLDSLKTSVTPISGFLTILKYLDCNSSEKKLLRCAITSRYGAGHKWQECHVYDGNILSVVTYVDSYPQIFLSQQFKRMIRKKGYSVVRQNKGTPYVYPRIDTTGGIYQLPTIQHKTYNLQNLSLFQDYWLYGKDFVTDFIVKRAALAKFDESEFSYTYIGSFDECIKVGDYFNNNYALKSLPPNLQKLSLSEGYWHGDVIVATFRFIEKGKEIFLSREGYALLKDGGFVILRATNLAENDEWRKFEIYIDPEVLEW